MMKYILLVSSLILSATSFAKIDSLMSTMSMAAKATYFQDQRIKIASENIANINSLASHQGGKPYRRKVIFAKHKFDRSIESNILVVDKYSFDKTPFGIKYDPEHPAADENGIVKTPNVRKEVEIADLNEAMRAHEANILVIDTTRDLINKTLESMK